MPAITKVVLRNFKRFDKLDLLLKPGLNVLLGDNEAGKSSVLLAIDLALSASRSKIESLGVEALLTPLRSTVSWAAAAWSRICRKCSWRFS